jgi:hypothetical protein
MTNQNTASDAKSTTATGTTMAGMSVERFELDCFAAALLVAAADVADDVVVRTVDEEEAAAATDVREAYSAEFVMVRVTSVVKVVSPVSALSARVCVSVMVVKPETAWAVTIGAVAEGSAVATAVVPIDCGRLAVGLSIRAGSVSAAWAARLCRPRPCLSILPGCMAGRMKWSSPAMRSKGRRQEAKVDEVLLAGGEVS